MRRMRGQLLFSPDRRHIYGCHFIWNLSRSCPTPSRLLHSETFPLLPHQLNLSRPWGGKSSCFALFTSFRVLLQHPSSAVNATSQPGKQGKHIRQPLLGSLARVRMDLFTSAAFRLIERFTLSCIRQYDIL